MLSLPNDIFVLDRHARRVAKTALQFFPSLRAAAGGAAIQSHIHKLREPSGAGTVPPMKQPAAYIMASRRNGTLHAGVTSNLPQRVWHHREGTADGFTKRYGCQLLVWFEMHETMATAIAREKQLKAGSRARKLALIEAQNPDWRDLYPDLF